MKTILFVGTLFFSSLSFAEINSRSLPAFIKSIEGKYRGEYGVLNKKECSVKIRGQEAYPNDIAVSIKREDGLQRTFYLQPGHFLLLNEGNEITDPEYFGLEFDQDLKVSSANVLKQKAVFTFQRLRCHNLIKVEGN